LEKFLQLSETNLVKTSFYLGNIHDADCAGDRFKGEKSAVL